MFHDPIGAFRRKADYNDEKTSRERKKQAKEEESAEPGIQDQGSGSGRLPNRTYLSVRNLYCEPAEW